MEKINDSQSVSSLRDWRTGLDPDPSGADSSTVSSCVLSWSLTLLLTEESFHLKLSRLILVKVIKVCEEYLKKVDRRRKQDSNGMLLQEQTKN